MLTWRGTRRVYKRGGRTFRKTTPFRAYLPLVVDTEFQTLPNPDKYPEFHEHVLGRLQRIGCGSIP